MKQKYYLNKVIKNAHYWQYTEVDGKGKKPLTYFTLAQWVLIIISIVISLTLLSDGFNTEFAGYTNAFLAIIVGLYLTIIIALFDKFDKKDYNTESLTDTEIESLKVNKNFLLQFTSLTTYSIILAFASIIFLSLSILTNMLNEDVTFCIIRSLWCNKDYLELTRKIGVLMYRITTIYLLLDIVYISCYTISSTYSYIVGEYNSIKISEDES